MISIPSVLWARGRPLLFAAGTVVLLACTLPAAHAAERNRTSPAIADFQRMSGARAAACEAPADPGFAAMGSPSARRCAWSQRIEMLYWETIPAPAGKCLPPAAIAWHRLSAAAQAGAKPWNAAWSGQSGISAPNGVQHAIAVWKRPDAEWSAIVWRWRPAPKPATRAWESRHWDEVVKAAQTINAGNPPLQATPLLEAWLQSTRGKPGVLENGTSRWVSERTCLVMQTAGISQGQLHLPHSRDDARLEQRSAMQVQLARRFPAAEWLQPFMLLDPAVPGTRSGAKFLAVWKEGPLIQGQLWIPRRDGSIVRARIGTDAPAKGDARSEEAIAQRAAVVQRELTALAHAWEVRHE